MGVSFCRALASRKMEHEPMRLDDRRSVEEVRLSSFCYESIPSDTSSASSTSTPRYLTVLSSFV
jgi:hypothetical protein